jgi:hypothetical protein
MSDWVTSQVASARLGVDRQELYRLVDTVEGGRLRFDRRRHAVLVPAAVLQLLSEQARAAKRRDLGRPHS